MKESVRKGLILDENERDFRVEQRELRNGPKYVNRRQKSNI